MKKQIPHKILMIIAILGVFALPFYLVSFQVPKLSYDDYVLSAAVMKGQSATPPETVQTNNAGAMADTAGYSFIGETIR